MQTLPDDELNKLRFAELSSNHRFALDSAHRLSERWVLWLAIGNGVGLLSISGKLIDRKSEFWTALLMPSCWLFAAGILAAGCIAPITVRRHELARHLWLSRTVNFSEGKAWQDLSSEEKAREKGLLTVESLLEYASGAAFLFGLVYPLIAISIRYLCSGHFFPVS